MTVPAPSLDMRPTLVPALAAGMSSLTLVLIGGFVDFPIGRHADRGFGIDTERQGLTDLVVLVVLVAVGTLVVFGVLVRRGLHSPAEGTASWSLAVAVAGAVTGFVPWTGLPVLLATAAYVLATDATSRLQRRPGRATAAVVLATLTVLGAVTAAVLG